METDFNVANSVRRENKVLAMKTRYMVSGRGQGLMRINHFMPLFIITSKQKAGIVNECKNVLKIYTTIHSK